MKLPLKNYEGLEPFEEECSLQSPDLARKVITSRLYGIRRTQVPHELCERRGLKDGDMLVWEIIEGREVRVYKARIDNRCEFRVC